jgi:hypothetical protein
VKGAELLQFRDVHGVSDKVAYLLSAGSGGRLPDLQDGERREDGIAMSDAVDGRFPVIRTTDDSWQAYPTPIVQGTPASGLSTVAFRDAKHGILAGGDLEPPMRADRWWAPRDGSSS